MGSMRTNKSAVSSKMVSASNRPMKNSQRSGNAQFATKTFDKHPVTSGAISLKASQFGDYATSPQVNKTALKVHPPQNNDILS